MTHAPLSDAELLELEMLERAATAGPWTVESCFIDTNNWGARRLKLRVRCYGGSGAEHADAQFLEAARTQLPRLIAEVRALRSIACTCDACAATRHGSAAKRDVDDGGVRP